MHADQHVAELAGVLGSQRLALRAGVRLTRFHAEHRDDALAGAVLHGERVQGPAQDLVGLLVVRDDDDMAHIGWREAERAHFILVGGPVMLTCLGGKPLAVEREAEGAYHANHEVGDDHCGHDEPHAREE